MGQVDLRLLVEKSLYEPLSRADIVDLSVSSRCELLARLLKVENRNCRPVRFGVVESATLKSIFTLNSNFEISENFHLWQKRRRQQLIREYKKVANKPILTAYKNWDRASLNAKKIALKRSVFIHRNVYMDGMFDRVPYSYFFRAGARRRIGNHVIENIGGFESDVKTGIARINQYIDHNKFLDVEEAFDTAHHEATHLIQFHFALARHKNQIPKAHPFFNEAEYFYSVDRRQAYVSHSTSQQAHWSQPAEVLARWEGGKIARSIKALALS